jgi:hypothetical protein
MLHFAAINHIHAKTQSMPMKEADSALDLVRKNKASYPIALYA